MALTQVTSAGVKDGELVNADFSSSAAIATSKISGSLTSVGSHGLAASATTDTTNASNLSSGTVAAARLDTATTQSAGNNSTKIATTAYADTAISNLVDSSPSALNTLNELAAALGDDANFSTTVTNSIAAKLPLAGGSLTGDVTFTGDNYNLVWDKSDDSLEFADNAQARFGASSDLKIYHDGSHNRIDSSNGNIYLRHGTDNAIKTVPNGTVELYYDDSKRIETTATGISVTGKVEISDDLDLTGASYNALWDKSANTLKFNDSAKVTLGTGADVTFYHDGSNTFLNSGTGYLLINNTASTSTILRGASDVFMQTAGGEQGVIARANGAVELYFDNAKKFETDANGAEVLGSRLRLSDSVKLACGASGDLEIYHDGSDSYIKDTGTGQLLLQTNELRVHNAAGNELQIQADENAGVKLFWNGTSHFETISTGAKVTGTLETTDTISTVGNLDMSDSTSTGNNRIRLGTGDDLEIYHDGTDSYITNATGNLYIKQGADTILLGVQNGATSIRYDGSTKLETQSGGVRVYGDLENHNDDFVAKDNCKFTAGNSADLQIYHNGSHSFITNTTGQVHLRGSSTVHLSDDAGYDHLKATKDGSVELYYDGSKTFETVATGAKVNGKLEVTDDLNLNGASYNALWDKSANQFKVNDSASIALGTDADCKLYHDGGSTWILNNTGHFYIRNNVDDDDGSNIYIQAKSGEGSIACIHDGGVYLYYDGSKKFETLTTGVHVDTNADLRFANGAWTGNAYGKIQHHGNSLYFQGGSNGFIFRSGAGVDLYKIDSSGHLIPQTNNAYDIGNSNYRVRNLYVNDAHFSNEGSQNSVDGTWGNWTLQEGEQDLFMINNRSGKKYKMALQEVS